MIIEPVVEALLREYPLQGTVIACHPLAGAGGFSGARFWRLSVAGSNDLCVRRWPSTHPSAERLRYIHQVVHAAAAAGIDYLPVPLRTHRGSSFVEQDGTRWEVSRWLPGKADFCESPSASRLRAALHALARFHTAVAESEPPVGASPGLADRLRQVDALRRGGLAELRQANRHVEWIAFRERAELLLRLAEPMLEPMGRELETACRLHVPQQAALRDVWHDHILFQGDRVTGLVDFGAMRRETVVGDVARLLGSLVPDDPDARQIGLAAYEELRPLSANERTLLPAFKRSTGLLSGLNWIRWIAVARRRFDDPDRVLSRLTEWLDQLGSCS